MPESLLCLVDYSSRMGQLTLSHIDPDFAKQQLLHMGYEWYQHGNGQYPASPLRKG